MPCNRDGAAEATVEILTLIREAKEGGTVTGNAGFSDVSAMRSRLATAARKIKAADELVKNTDWPMPAAQTAE